MAAMALAGLSASPAAADEIAPVQRFSFEPGEAMVWKENAALVAGYTREISTAGARTGDYAAHFSSTNTELSPSHNAGYTNLNSTTIPVKPNTEYTVSFWYQLGDDYQHGTNVGAYFMFRPQTAAGQWTATEPRIWLKPQDQTVGDEWRKREVTYTTDAVSARLVISFGFRGAIGRFALDDITVREKGYLAPGEDTSLKSVSALGISPLEPDPLFAGATALGIVLPAGTTEVPDVVAEANDPEATVAVQQATSFSEPAVVRITSADGSETSETRVRLGVTDLTESSLKSGPEDFTHPGVFHTGDELMFMREKVAQGAEPWTSAFDQLRRLPNASYHYQMVGPKAVLIGTVDGHLLRNDANAVYNLAIMYAITEDARYAAKAKEVIRAWTAEFRGFNMLESNLAWGPSGQKLAAGAEILRAYYDGWTQEDTDALIAMFTVKGEGATQSALDAATGFKDHNHGTTIMAALMAMAIFADNAEWYNLALEAYFYPIPEPDVIGRFGSSLPYNINPRTGQNKESDRDQGHSQGGIASIAATARLAHAQGDDALYRAYGASLLSGMEFAANYNLGYDVEEWESDFPWRYHYPQESSHLRGLISDYEQVYNFYSTQPDIDPARYARIAEVVSLPWYKPEAARGDTLGLGTLTTSGPERLIAGPPTVLDPFEPTPTDTPPFGRIAAARFSAVGGREDVPPPGNTLPASEPFEDFGALNGTRLGSWARYDDVDFDAFDGATTIALRASSNNNSAARWIDLYADTDGTFAFGNRGTNPAPSGGTYLGRINVAFGGWWTNFTTYYAPLLAQVSGTHDLYLVFGGAEDVGRTEFIANVNWLTFGPSYARDSLAVEVPLEAAEPVALGLLDFEEGASHVMVTLSGVTHPGVIELTDGDGATVATVRVRATAGADQTLRAVVTASPEGEETLTATWHPVAGGPTQDGPTLETIRFADLSAWIFEVSNVSAAVSHAELAEDAVVASNGGVVAYPSVNLGAGISSWSLDVAATSDAVIELRAVTRDGTKTGQPSNNAYSQGNTGTLLGTLQVPAGDGTPQRLRAELPGIITGDMMLFLNVSQLGGGTVTWNSFQLDPVSLAPVAQGLDLTVAAQAQLAGTVDATDVDNDSLTFSLADGAPEGVAVDPTTGVVTWTPTADQHGEHTFTVLVSDGDLATGAPVRVVVGGAAPELDVTLAATTRCVAGKVVLAVTSTNNEDVPVSLALTTPFGSKAIADLAPGRGVSHAFTTRQAGIDEGSVSATVTASIDGQSVQSEQSATFAGRTC